MRVRQWLGAIRARQLEDATIPIRRLALVACIASSACDAAPESTPATEPVLPDRAGLDTAVTGHAAGETDTLPHRGDSTAVTVVFRRGEQPEAIERTVPAAHPLRGALEALVAGPTSAERAAGIESWFSETTAGSLRTLETADGLIVVDLADLSPRIPNASSSLGSTLLLDELNGTVFSNSDADSVEYRFDGSCSAFGEFVQRGCLRYGRTSPDP